MDKLFIVIPAYNETENICAVVEEWHPVVAGAGAESRLVLFNDGSKDNTYAIAVSLKERYPQLEVVDKPNSGHGPTCLYAYRHALAAGADYIFQTDSDGQTCPEDFGRFWQLRSEHPFIIGTRQGRQDGFSRKVVTVVLQMVLLAIFGAYVRDANTPFRLMNAKVLPLYLAQIPPDFFLGNVLLSVAAVKRGENIKWLPITFKPRQGGENSLNLRKIFLIGIKAVRELRHFMQDNKAFLKRGRLEC
ncbi:MAG: glycosyltransferase family 2 protein [Negativicutes bacterium]|nr:glycosyltransferase family 2 protein [Negativicutes bacterium]